MQLVTFNSIKAQDKGEVSIMTLYEMDEKINHDSDILDKIRDIVEGTIDHLDRDDALDMLYEIKRLLRWYIMKCVSCKNI